jgi:catechol 2,3-dioxygenase-like lactoylglutathione lyase family enzyme
MDLGNFSVSLAVKDIDKSLAFYETFGFEVVGGSRAENWLILQRPGATIGLFQGMFDENIMTFNPLDVRSVQKELKAKGIKFALEVDEFGEGPGHATLEDPDGNQILLDQHQ